MSEYIGPDEAAKHAGIPRRYLMDMCRKGNKGPKFYRPSPKKTFFLRSDIDAWVKSWKTPETE